jgi:hypothetical protein
MQCTWNLFTERTFGAEPRKPTENPHRDTRPVTAASGCLLTSGQQSGVLTHEPWRQTLHVKLQLLLETKNHIPEDCIVHHHCFDALDLEF